MNVHLTSIFCSLLVLFLAYVSSTIWKNFISSTRQIPGPFLARFTRLWYLRNLCRGDFQHLNITLHQRFADKSKSDFYAPIVRLGPNLYSISSPDKAIYGIGSRMRKSSWYDGWRTPSFAVPTLFTEQNISQHNEMRRKVQTMYSLSSLVSYEPYVDECTAILQTRLREMATADSYGSHRVVDMGHWFQCYAFDVIGSITYSKRFGFLDMGKDEDKLIDALDRNMAYASAIGVYPWIHPWVYKVMQFIPRSGAASRQLLGRFARRSHAQWEVQSEAAAIVATSGEDEKARLQPQDFLTKLVAMQKDGKHTITKSDFINVEMSNLVAGSDTTAVSLSSIFYHLVRNPKCLANLREEILEMTREGRCETDRVSFKDSQNMPYLQAVIKESLRLHPAVGLPLWRVVEEEGMEICNQWLPKGSEVGVNAWVAHYNRDIWGQDVNQFRPERWIEVGGDSERLKIMEQNFLPFGLGSRTCIGRHISYLEMTKVVPQIVRNFDLELERPLKAWTCRNFWFVKPQDFYVKIKLLSTVAASHSRFPPI